ncbi:hypothetical protein ACH4FX_42560 [Streptomyces sp. NPDC018019]|uniref:hypothetical protein n=1 Tax=Streptomyces sp. NPDC018019 TaxID=3365030 RepID=UPI0037A0EC64
MRLPSAPLHPDPGDDPAHQEERHRYLAFRKVRHTVLPLIGDHDRRPQGMYRSWQGCDLDLTGGTIDGDMDFSGATFASGVVSFNHATFCGATVYFYRATFCGSTVLLSQATFSGGTVTFGHAEFSGSEVAFRDAAGPAPTGFSPPSALPLP